MSPLSLEARRSLLRLARQTLEAEFRGQPLDLRAVERDLAAGALGAAGSAFVTLHARGCLRGCIGYMDFSQPLYLVVMEAARAAAFRDPRFPPLALAELAEVVLEVSVLSPSVAIRPEEVEVGRHGLIVSQGSLRGVLLPQVAVECGWDRGRFLEETCQKAGLPPDAWEKGARLEAFTAEVFAEELRKDPVPVSLLRPSFE